MPSSRRCAPLAVAVLVVVGLLGAVDADAADAPDRRVKVFYFHRKFRCPSCLEIEATVQKAIETHFRSELADGRIAWRAVNLSDKGNEHFVKDYQLVTNSLVLVDERKGRDVRFKALDRIYELVGKEAEAVAFVRDELRQFLEGAGP